MCGIVGIASKRQDVENDILNTLSNLEYRGYDSAGIAVLKNNNILCKKVVGKINDLRNLVSDVDLSSSIGIGHTRWATHGAVNTLNAHPHCTENIALVHNGIIENYDDIKSELQKEGYVFKTETDTEAILFLIDKYISKGLSPLDSVINSLKHVVGAFALAIIFKNYNDLMIGVKKGAPLVVGKSDNHVVIASDVTSISKIVDDVIYLKDENIVQIKSSEIEVFDTKGNSIKAEFTKVQKSLSNDINKNGYSHYMLKEISEQPMVIENLNSNYNNIIEIINEQKLNIYKKIIIVACGTSYYAGLVAKYWFEKFTTIDCMVYTASEFCYLKKRLNKDYLVICISQSGETADTLASLKYSKSLGVKTIGIVNVPKSSIDNEADYCFYTFAGPEIGVASTKCFTAQLTVLLKFILGLAEINNETDHNLISKIYDELSSINDKINEVLSKQSLIAELAEYCAKFKNAIYLGRQNAYPIALEGALKIKEISYIHAEGYSAGELKHGPLALVDENMLVVVIANSTSEVYLKTISNMENVIARNGNVIIISDKKLDIKNVKQFVMPSIIDDLTPILYAIPVQLLAFYVAKEKGTDIDKPRNLAKSVTVE